MSRTDRLFGPELRMEEPDTVNKEGYPAFEKSEKEKYLQMVMNNSLGNTFYARPKELLDKAESLHSFMSQEDPVFMAKALIFARNEGFMKTQPTFGLVKLWEEEPELARKIFPRVVRIPSDLQDMFTMMKATGRGFGQSVKKAVNKFLNRMDEYWVLKYGGGGRGFTLADIIRLTRPVPKDERQSLIFQYLTEDSTERNIEDYKELPQIYAYETVKRIDDNKKAVELVKKNRLPYNIISPVVTMDKNMWNALVQDMPVFALLRHLNALDECGAYQDNEQLIEDKLTNPEIIKKAKILPFRFLTAFEHVDNPEIKDMLRIAVENAVDNIPQIPGSTAIYIDTSGSMGPGWFNSNTEHLLLTAGVFGYGLFKRCDSVRLRAFNTQVYNPGASKVDSVLSQAENLSADGGTDIGCTIFDLHQANRKVDNIIVLTDEQQNTGSSFYSQLENYRYNINDRVKTFVIDVSSYAESGKMTPDNPNDHYIFGWSDNVLKYIRNAIKGYETLMEDIESIEL